MEAPVNLYFETTPIGRIMNKFSRDLNALEMQQGWMMGMLFANFYALLQVFIVAIFAVKWIGIAIPVVLLVCYFITRKAA